MKRSTKFALAGLAVVATAGAAFAAQGMRHFGGPERLGQRLFDKADANKDGAVSQDELLAVLTVRFDAADTNGDGSLDKAEIIAAVDKEFPRASRYSGRISDRVVYRFDLDDNGSVAKSELENRVKKVFALADWNDDGKVEMTEIRRMRPRGGPGFHWAGFHGPRMGWHRFGGWWHDGPLPTMDDNGQQPGDSQ